MRNRIFARLAAVLTVVAIGAAAGCDMPLSRAEQCRADGNTVTRETEYDKKAKRFYTEYECEDPQGNEVDSWR